MRDIFSGIWCQFKRLNNNVAFMLAAWFCSMACFYVCCGLIAVGFIWPSTMEAVQFISSGVIQLVALPILGVANTVSTLQIMRLLYEMHAVNLALNAKFDLHLNLQNITENEQ